MANSLLKLTVESSEYDAKLKKAAEGIRHLADRAHESAGELTGLEKSEIDFIKALGEMETKSRSAAGKTRELENAFKELTVVYNELNDREKADEGGKALAASLEKLKQRAIDAKSGLNEATQALQGNTQASSTDMKGIEGLTSALGLNITKLAGWGAALGAAQVALDIAKDAFFASESNVDEWGRTVEASTSLYEGFLNAINNGDISGYLNRMNDIVMAAAEAYNELDKLGTMKTIQSPKVSAQQTENERMRMMIQTGRYIAPIDGRKASMSSGTLLSKEQIKALEEKLKNGMQDVVKLIGNEVKQTGKAIDAYYNRIAQENGISLDEFKRGTSSWEEFSKKMEGYESYRKWNAEAMTKYASQGGRGRVNFDKTNPYVEFKKWGNFRVDKMGEDSYNDLVQLIQQRDQQAGQVYSMQSQAYRVINRAEGITLKKLLGNESGKTPQEQAQKAVESALLNYQQAIDKAAMEFQSGAITEADVKKKTLSAQESLYDAYGKAYATYADPKYKTAQDAAAVEILKLGGEVKKSTEAQEAQKKAARELEQAQKKAAEEAKKRAALMESWKTASTGAMESLKKDLLKRQGKTAVGSAEFNDLQANIVDVSNLQTLINTALKNGLIIDPEIPNMLMQQIVGGKDIDNKVWENLQRQLNDRLKEMNLDPLNLNFNTGEVKTGKKSDLMGDSKKVIGGLSQVASGLQQMGVELPKEVQQVIGVIQGVMSVIEGINTVISITQTTALTANTAAMVALTTALWANTGVSAIPFFAHGGIVPHAANGYFVPGNNFSGDTTPILANAGELVLNKSSQNNLASMITEAEGRGRGGNGLARVSGEQIWIALNAYTNRTGRGELVTWKD